MAALAVALLGAIVRSMGLSKAAFALPGALVLVLTRVVSWSQVGDALRDLGPTVLFLAGILLFGHLCAEAGVFDYLGAVAARIGRGQARRLLGTVVALAAGVTAILTLDATVVLLTPVVLRTTQQLRVRSRPHLYACAHLANSGSLLPVSNLTNLLAFAATGLSFGRFTALMALPWTVACLLDWGRSGGSSERTSRRIPGARGVSEIAQRSGDPCEVVQRVVLRGAAPPRSPCWPCSSASTWGLISRSPARWPRCCGGGSSPSRITSRRGRSTCWGTKYPPDTSRRDRGPVGVSGDDRRMIIGTNRRRAAPGVGSRHMVREL